MILGKGGHNEAGRLREVYNHPQPSQSVEITPKEALPAGCLIAFSRVGSRHSVEDRWHVGEHLRSASGEVTLGAFIEHHLTAVGVGCLTGVA